MSSFLGILTRNAPLKLGAVVLATVLYAGLVFSQNVRVWPGPVPIEPFGQGSDVFILDISPQAVTSIRFVAPGDVAGTVSGQSFRATVDLSGLVPASDGAPLTAPVTVEALDPRIQVTGWSPAFVSVRLDPVTTRTVPVRVDRGAVPEGLSAGEAQVDVTGARVRGPASVVERVDAAVARVIVDASGVDVDQDVDLIAVDARGDRLTPVDFDPPSVHVRIEVAVAGTTRTVAVVPVVEGTPAAGYAIGAVRVQPVSVVISGPRSLLETIEQLETRPVSVDGARADLTETVALDLPDGVSVEGSETVRVSISVAALTGSRTYSVAVVLTGISDASSYTLSSGSVLVTISGTLVSLNALDGSSLQAVGDVAGLGEGVHIVALGVAVPGALTVTGVSPSTVSVTVASVATPTPPP